MKQSLLSYLITSLRGMFTNMNTSAGKHTNKEANNCPPPFASKQSHSLHSMLLKTGSGVAQGYENGITFSRLSLTRCVLLVALILGSVNVWGETVTVFKEGFGSNADGNNVVWNDAYKQQSGISDVYSSASYIITAKRSKNTTGQTGAGLMGENTDTYFEVGPLNVANYSSLTVEYMWKPGSTKKTYHSTLYYKTSQASDYTEVSKSNNPDLGGGGSYVLTQHTLPEAASVSTLFLKLVFSTSNTTPYIDEFELTGTASSSGGGDVTTYSINLNQSTGGTISASASTAAAGTEITLTATPNNGYVLDSWTVIDGEANEVTVTNNKFTMPASDVEVEATFTTSSGGGGSENTITITRESFPNDASSYAWYDWTSGDITGKGFIYGSTKASMQFNSDKTGRTIFNTGAIPGNITSIKITKAEGSSSARSWALYCGTAAATTDSDTNYGEKIGDTQTVSTSGVTWNVSGSYNYFMLYESGGSTNISEIVITYETGGGTNPDPDSGLAANQVQFNTSGDNGAGYIRSNYYQDGGNITSQPIYPNPLTLDGSHPTTFKIEAASYDEKYVFKRWGVTSGNGSLTSTTTNPTTFTKGTTATVITAYFVQPTLTANHASLDFGTIDEGESFQTKDVSITGEHLTAIPDITFTGTHSDKFRVSNGTLTTDGGTLTIECIATQGGTYEADLYLTSLDDNVDLTVGLKAQINAAAECTGTPLATPTELSVTETPTTATLSWNAVANAESYSVDIVGDTYEQTQSVEKTKTSWTFTGLTPEKDYLWTVTAIGNHTTTCDSDPSEGPEFTTPARYTLAAPTNLRTDALAQNSVTLLWDEVPHATGYTVAISGGTYNTPTISGTSATVTGLKASTDYTWTVTAIGDADYINSSANETFRTLDIPTYTLKTAVVGSGSISLNKEGPQYAETEIIATATPTTGHRFVRWDYDGTAANCTTNGNKATIKLEASNDYTITATFEAIPTYEVIWLNGSETHHSQSVTHGDNIGALPAPPTGKGDCAGKTFVGWTTAEVTDGNKPSVLFKDVTGGGIHLENITGAKTFYAVFADKGAVVGSITEFETGDYYLITLVEDTYYAMSGKLDGKEVAAIDITAAITDTDGIIYVDSENAVITDNMKYNVSGTVSAASIKNIQNNAYIGWSGSDLVSNNTNKWAVTSLNGAFQFASSSNSRCIMYRANYGFRSYLTTADYSSGYLYLVPAVEPDYSNYSTECAECNEPTVTVNDGTCAVNSTLNLLGPCFTSTNNNNATFSCEQEGQTIDGSVFKPTKVGEYTITVTQPIDKTTTPYTCGVSETFKVTVTCLEANAIELNTATVDVAEATISWVKDASISRYEVTVDGVDAVNIEVDQADGKAIVTGLNENTKYNYTVTGIVDKDVYCDNVTAQGSFKTNEIPSHDITWLSNGQDWSTGATTSVKHGSKITDFPTTKPSAAAGCHEKEFVGWISAANLELAGEEPFATAPDGLFTDIDGSPEITVATTFHAVFADVTSTTEPGEPVTSWELVTTVPSDAAGEYVIVAAGNTKYVMKAVISSSRFSNGTNATISGTKMTSTPAADEIWTIYKHTDGYFRIKNGSNYAGGTDSDNQGALLTDETADRAKWSISYNNGFVIENVGRSDKDARFLRNNNTYGWGTYKSNSSNAPTLYKKTTTTDDITTTTIKNYVTTCSSGIPVTVVISPAEAEAAGATAIAEHTDLTVNGQTELTVTNVPRGWTFTNWTTSSQGASIENATAHKATLKVGSAPVEVSANFTALTKCSVTWQCNGVNYTTGSPTATVYSGEQVTELPDAPTVPSGCAFDKVFVGWTAREDYGEPNDVAPGDLFTTAEGSPVITADVTFHAVFAAPPYRKITSASELTDGTYLIVAEGKDVVAGAQNERYRIGVKVTIVDNVINSLPDGACEFTITKTGSNYTIVNGSDYLAYSGSDNGIYTSTETNDNSSWTIGFDDSGNAVVKNVAVPERSIWCNNSSSKFACYTSTSQTEVQLFKKSTTRGYITLCDNNDVVVNTGTTWTVATDVTVNDLVVEAGAKVEVEAGATLNVATLTLKSDFDAVPQLVMNGSLHVQDSKLKLIKHIDDQRYYFFSVPYDYSVENVEIDGTTGSYAQKWIVAQYDGAQRTLNGGHASNWIDQMELTELKAGTGYAIALANNSGEKDLVFTFSLTSTDLSADNKKTASYKVTAHGKEDYEAGKLHQSNVGWNFVANPFLSEHTSVNNDNFSMPTPAEYMKYVAIPQVGTHQVYLQHNFSDLGKDKNPSMLPFTGFFIQVAEDGSVVFTKGSDTSPASMLAPQHTEAEQPLIVGLNLTNGTYTDATSLVIGDQFTDAYEIGSDFEKMLGLEQYPQLYIHDEAYRYAFKSISKEAATRTIPLGVYLPAKEATEYTIAMKDDVDVSRLQAVYLTDYEANTQVNLLDGDYRFTATGAHLTERFALSAVLATGTTTDLTHVSTTWSVWQDAPRHIRIDGITAGERVRVLDATGKVVYTTTANSFYSEISLPQAGAYCVQVMGVNGLEVKKVVVK